MNELTAATDDIRSLPKFPASQVENGSAIPRSLFSLILYLLAGYWLLNDFHNLILITLVLLLHEGGHFIAMRRVGYRDLGVFFLPLLGAYVSGTKRVVTQRESAFVLLAGPLPGILLGSALYVGIEQGVVPRTIYDFNIMTGVIFLVVLNGINLLPIYPLDGGQLLNRIFLDEEGWVSKGFVLLSAVLLAYMAIHYRIIPLLIFPFLLLFRLWRSATDRKIERRIEDEGIETELDYEALPDVDYWRIRHILIEENASIRSLAAEHVDTYSPAETQIQQAVEAQLHRTLVQDLSVSAKVLIGLIWMSSLLVPLYLWLR